MDGFLAESAYYLRDVHLRRIGEALEILPLGDLWWRPHAGMTSAGNLILHLEGNVRQWILGGLGGAPDTRRRAAEFAATEGSPFPALEATVTAAAEVLENLDPARLPGPLHIQGFATTGMKAVYHVVEHFSWHTGQIVWIAKMRAGPGHGLAFYDDAKLNRA